MNPIIYFSELSILSKSIALLVFTLVAYLGIVRSGLSLAPWVPTHKRDLKRVNKICNLKAGDTFMEAGCGNALVTKYIAKQNPAVQCIGVEYSPLMFGWAKVVGLLSGLPNLKIVYGDVLAYDLSSADVVYIYGLTRTVNQKLLPKIKQELRSGARFISYAFEIKDEHVVKDENKTSSSIYIFRQPFKKNLLDCDYVKRKTPKLEL